jgi:hypothetical protein
VTTASIKEEMIGQLKTIISSTENCSKTGQIVLGNIKQNDLEIDNTLSLGRIFVEIGNELDCVTYLAQRCHDKLSCGNFEYVCRTMALFGGLSGVLFDKLSEGASADLAMINLTNSLFLPHFSNTDCSALQISQLCEVFYRFMSNASGPCCNLVQTLVQSNQHRVAAFAAFLKLQTDSEEAIFLSVDLVTEMFDILNRESCQEFENTICNLAVLAERVPALRKHLMDYITMSLQEEQLSDKLITLLRVMKWSNSVESHVATIQLILDWKFTGESVKTLAPVLNNITAQCPDFSDMILHKITDILDTYPEEVSDCLYQVFQTKPEFVISYFVNDLPRLTVGMSLLMDLHKKYGVLNMADFCEGDLWNESQVFKFKTCVEFIAKAADFMNTGIENVVDLVKLIVYELTLNVMSDLSSKILDSIKMKDPICYRVVDELIRKNNMFIIYVVKDLINHGFEIDWRKVENLESLSLESLVSLSFAFEDVKLFKELTESKKDSELSVMERLCYINFTSYSTMTSDNEEIFEFLTNFCFDPDNTDHRMTARIFSVFLPILFHQTSASEEDIQFVLNSTAATLQTIIDILSDTPSNRERYHLTASLVSFTKLYSCFHDCLKVQKQERFQEIMEDWDAFYEPGIQDLVLVLHDKILSLSLHDKILSLSLPETASFLSPVILLAPSASVKSFMKSALDKSEDISFEECFEYVLKCYDQLPYETQTALFYLLLHCQKLFPQITETEVVTDDEAAEFASPPVIFLDALSTIDLVNFESEVEYESRLIKAAQIWTLLLISESKQSAEVMREHVEFLRSKQILSEFLDNIVYLIKFSSKKYEIVPMDMITEHGGFESHQLASTCFMGIATVFPALLRNWWKKLGKELTISVEKYVTSFVSPSLIKLETNLRTNPEDETLVVRLDKNPIFGLILPSVTRGDEPIYL